MKGRAPLWLRGDGTIVHMTVVGIVTVTEGVTGTGPSEPRHGDADSSRLREVVDSHGAELQDLRGRVGRVGMLSLQSSRDAGEFRAGVEAVFFLTGQARERVMGVLKDYNAEKVSTLKFLAAAWESRLSRMLPGRLTETGPGRSWLPLLIMMRDLWGADELKPLWQKVGGNWAEVGFKPGAYQAVVRARARAASSGSLSLLRGVIRPAELLGRSVMELPYHMR